MYNNGMFVMFINVMFKRLILQFKKKLAAQFVASPSSIPQ